MEARALLESLDRHMAVADGITSEQWEEHRVCGVCAACASGGLPAALERAEANRK